LRRKGTIGAAITRAWLVFFREHAEAMTQTRVP